MFIETDYCKEALEEKAYLQMWIVLLSGSY
jgi:hypothetical protein